MAEYRVTKTGKKMRRRATKDTSTTARWAQSNTDESHTVPGDTNGFCTGKPRRSSDKKKKRKKKKKKKKKGEAGTEGGGSEDVNQGLLQDDDEGQGAEAGSEGPETDAEGAPQHNELRIDVGMEDDAADAAGEFCIMVLAS